MAGWAIVSVILGVFFLNHWFVHSYLKVRRQKKLLGSRHTLAKLIVGQDDHTRMISQSLLFCRIPNIGIGRWSLHPCLVCPGKNPKEVCFGAGTTGGRC